MHKLLSKMQFASFFILYVLYDLIIYNNVLTPTRPVKIFYLEHVISSWVLQQRIWNVYHSGIGFIIDETKFYTVEFVPDHTESVGFILKPTIDLSWENGGSVKYSISSSGFPSKFSNIEELGTLSPTQFTHIIEWIFKYGDTHTTFEPVEIVIPGSPLHNKPSSMCHDFVSAMIVELKKNGFKETIEKQLFRDHIILYASNYTKVNFSTIDVNEIIGFYNLFQIHMDKINEDFTNIRLMLEDANSKNISTFLYYGKEYYRVYTVEPWVNYCYLELSFSNKRSSSFKECALV